MMNLMEYSTEENAQHWLEILQSEELEFNLEKLEKGMAGMDDKDELKAQIKKLNSQATALKMDLHDLSEDLPTGWEKIPDVASRAHQAYQTLEEARKRLADLG